MSQEGQVSEPAVAAPVVSAPAPAPAPAAATPPAAEPPEWALKRIDRLTADLRETERKLAAREASPPASAVPAPVPPVQAAPAAPVAPQFDPVALEAKATEIANTRVSQQEFQGKVGSIAQEGLKAHPGDWAATIGNLQRINALDPDIINVVHSLGNAHELIYALGKDMNEAARIASLPSAQKGVALAQFAAKVSEDARKKISGAAEPIPDVMGGNSPATGLSDKDSMDEWARKRAVAKAARRTGRAA